MNEMKNVVNAYLPNEVFISCAPLGNGHIHSRACALQQEKPP